MGNSALPLGDGLTGDVQPVRQLFLTPSILTAELHDFIGEYHKFLFLPQSGGLNQNRDGVSGLPVRKEYHIFRLTTTHCGWKSVNWRLQKGKTSPSLLRNATSPTEERPWQREKLSLFAKGSPNRGAGERKLD